MLRKISRLILFPFKRLRIKSTRSLILTIIIIQITLSLWVYERYFDHADNILHRTYLGDKNQNTTNTKSIEDLKISVLSYTQPILDLLPSLSSNSANKLPNAATLYKKMMFDTSPTWIDEYHLNSNLLTVPMGNNKGKQLESIDDLTFYDSDPRLTWSVYLYHILQSIDNNNNNDMNNLKIPFSWYDWVDFHNYNKLVAVKDTFNQKFDCNFAVNSYVEKELLQKIETELQEPLFNVDRYRYEDNFWYRTITRFDSGIEKYNLSHFCIDKFSNFTVNEDWNTSFNLPFKINNIWTRLRPEMYQIHARNFILNTLSHPLSLTILESTKDSYQVYLEQNDRSNMVQSNLLANFIKANQKGNNDIKFDHVDIFNKFLENDSVKQKLTVKIPVIDSDIYSKDKVELTLDDFKVDIKSKIEELESLDEDNKLSPHEKNYLESLKVSYKTHPALAPKYLDEASDLQGAAYGHHRDKRFYNDANVDTGMFKQARMNSLIRNFQKLINSNGLISWLSHGTLYGHLYDGLAFPWDSDFDLQMPLKHLHILAQYYNQSLLVEDPREGNGRFFLDVTSSISVRTNANGKNNIDARFIDVDSGLYIDITGLSVSSAMYKKGKTDIIPPNKYKEIKEEILATDSLVKNPELGQGLAAKSLEEIRSYVKEHPDLFVPEDLTVIQKMISDETKHHFVETNLDYGLSDVQRYFVNDKLQLVNCRNNHFSRLDMISPLRITYFHGVRSFVPNKVIESLQNEYKVPKKYGFQSFEGKSYLPKLKQWILFPVLKRICNINGLYEEMLPLESQATALSFPEVKKVLANMITGKYYDLFSYTATTFDVTNYRIKELEIIFDSKLSIEDKSALLSIMRDKIGPRLNSPMKDALLFTYENRIWEIFERELSESELNNIKESVSYDVLLELSKDFAIFNSNHWFNNILSIVDEEVVEKYHIDSSGIEIYDGIENVVNTIFEHDPAY